MALLVKCNAYFNLVNAGGTIVHHPFPVAIAIIYFIWVTASDFPSANVTEHEVPPSVFFVSWALLSNLCQIIEVPSFYHQAERKI